jgi:Zn-dependent M28 family amino/carboxypeptidase
LAGPGELAKLSTDERVLASLSLIEGATIASYMRTLTSFRTRHSMSPLNLEAASWISKTFKDIGYMDVTFHPFALGDVERHNVLCTKPGGQLDTEVILFCAHFDSRMSDLEDSQSAAPGADDNASGISALLELARVVMQSKLRYALQFAAFSGEEQGLIGSTAYAEYVHSKGIPIRLVVNLDMIAHAADPASPLITIEYDTGNSTTAIDAASQAYAGHMAQLATTYTTLKTKFGPIYSSDYMPFEHHGYVCTGLFDGADNQSFYHSSDDTEDRVSLTMCREVVKLLVATALTVGELAS